MNGKSLDIPEKISEKVIEYLIATPKALLFVVCSYFSGQLWLFIISTYFKKGKKGNKHLEGIIGRTALGIAWFALFLAPIHWLKFQTFQVEPENIFSILLGTILLAGFAQTIAFILITLFKSEK